MKSSIYCLFFSVIYLNFYFLFTAYFPMVYFLPTPLEALTFTETGNTSFFRFLRSTFLLSFIKYCGWVAILLTVGAGYTVNTGSLESSKASC